METGDCGSQNTQDSFVNDVQQFTSSSSNCAGSSYQTRYRGPNEGEESPNAEELDALALQLEQRARDALGDLVAGRLEDFRRMFLFTSIGVGLRPIRFIDLL